ncbi:MAG: S-methyl-5-thioribose-1-phosphate isomerase [Leptonema sp. (in: bacteria)]
MIYTPSILFENEELKILDQTLLPLKKKYITIHNLQDGCEAIVNLRIRGAPAIGVMAALTIYIEMKRLLKENFIKDVSDFLKNLEISLEKIGNTRPTAYNLFYTIKKIKNAFLDLEYKDPQVALQQLKQVALNLWEEDKKLCEEISQNAQSLIFDGSKILTHCNTGSLATSGKGTALGAIYTAWEQGKKIYVYNTETRPLLQGSRITSFELSEAKIPNTLITDSMVASLFQNHQIDCVMVGADRIAVNGDTANKIGTFSIAIIAKYFNIPFFVLAPSSTIDVSLKSGDEILIEQRKDIEVKQFLDCISTVENVNVYNPAFDVTPANLITAIITEKGIFRYPYNFLR